jgi:5-formyltetrahydrofolate cyclo-ligase
MRMSPATFHPAGESRQQRSAIRREARRARRALSPSERFIASHALCRHLAGSGLLLRHRRFAAFYPNDAEVDLSPLFPRLWQQRKHLYLPVINGAGLWFMEYRPDTPLRDNVYGIPEPQVSAQRRLALRALDVLLMPLVAFDDFGHRIGMGGGYYDRTLARHHDSGRRGRPLRIGVGYELQRYPSLPTQPWDVPLDGAVTENGLRWFRTQGSSTSMRVQ